MKSIFCLLVILTCSNVANARAPYTDIPIPRSMADKGHYYLLEVMKKGDLRATLHKRVGPNETGYTRVEMNCKTRQYRDVGYSEVGPEAIKPAATGWTGALEGSSKGDLVNFVCAMK